MISDFYTRKIALSKSMRAMYVAYFGRLMKFDFPSMNKVASIVYYVEMKELLVDENKKLLYVGLVNSTGTYFEIRSLANLELLDSFLFDEYHGNDQNTNKIWITLTSEGKIFISNYWKACYQTIETLGQGFLEKNLANQSPHRLAFECRS